MTHRMLQRSLALISGFSFVVLPSWALTSTATSCSAPSFQLYGGPVKIVATIASADGTAPSGQVAFLDFGSAIGSAAVAQNGSAQIAALLKAGTHAITCSYLGDANLAASMSGLQAVVIGTATPTVTITASPSSPSPGQRVEIDVTVAAKTGGSPTGNVALMDGNAVLAVLPLMDLDNGAIATFVTATLAPGTHSLTASYPGDANFTAATTANPLLLIVGSISTTIQITASPNPVEAGRNVALTATVASAGGAPQGTVTFQAAQQVLGTAPVNSAGQASITTMFAGAGAQAITALYAGTGLFQNSTSSVLNLPVIPRKLVIALAPSGAVPIAPDSIVSLLGDNLAAAAVIAPSAPLPTSLGGISVVFRDSAGVERPAALAFVSPAQINAVVPADTATGQATVTVKSGAGDIASGSVAVVSVAPAIFSADGTGSGAAAALAETVHADGSVTNQSVFHCEVSKCTTVALDLGGDGDQTFLILFGTGIRHGGSSVGITIAGQNLTPEYAGPQSQFPGLDQLNVLLPQSLRGTGETAVFVNAADRVSNAVSIRLQ